MTWRLTLPVSGGPQANDEGHGKTRVLWPVRSTALLGASRNPELANMPTHVKSYSDPNGIKLVRSFYLPISYEVLASALSSVDRV